MSKRKTIEDVKKLIAEGYDINSLDSDDKTLLHKVENAQVAKFLIENGANVNAKDDQGKTPLHCAKDAEIAKVLIDAGADVNAKDAKGKTPLLCTKCIETAELLCMYCGKCGALLEDDSETCEKCGNPVAVHDDVFEKLMLISKIQDELISDWDITCYDEMKIAIREGDISSSKHSRASFCESTWSYYVNDDYYAESKIEDYDDDGLIEDCHAVVFCREFAQKLESAINNEGLCVNYVELYGKNAGRHIVEVCGLADYLP